MHLLEEMNKPLNEVYSFKQLVGFHCALGSVYIFADPTVLVLYASSILGASVYKCFYITMADK